MELLSRKHWELFLTSNSYTSCVISQRYCTFACCLTSHLYAHCLFPSYFRNIFLPQWWKHMTMKRVAMDSFIISLFRKEVTMFQDLVVLYPLSSFCWSTNSLKLLLKPFSVVHHFHSQIYVYYFHLNVINRHLSSGPVLVNPRMGIVFQIMPGSYTQKSALNRSIMNPKFEKQCSLCKCFCKL